MPHRSNRTTQYQYFDAQLGGIDWRNKKILDFGGNIGGFLVGAPDTIQPENYWCLDVDQGACEIGQMNHPRANFRSFNQYNAYDNPGGEFGVKIPFESASFDIIIALSVFTHVSRPDMLNYVAQLKTLLKPGGVLAFTYSDGFFDPTKAPNWDVDAALPNLFEGSNFEKLFNFCGVKNIEAAMERAKGSRWSTLVNDDFRVEPPDTADRIETENAHYLQFYDSSYIQSLFPEGKIMQPIAPELQHCVIISN